MLCLLQLFVGTDFRTWCATYINSISEELKEWLGSARLIGHRVDLYIVQFERSV